MTVSPALRCEDPAHVCTHETAIGIDAWSLTSKEGPHGIGFVWSAKSEEAIRAAGDWDQDIQDRIKFTPKQRERQDARPAA